MHNRSVRVLVWLLMIVVGLVMVVLAGPARAETDQNPAWPCVATPTHGILHCDTPEATATAPVPTTKASPVQTRGSASPSTNESVCDGWDVGECLSVANCSFAVMACKQQDRECREWRTTPPTAAPQNGEWIQNEYWPEACYIVDGHEVLWESELERIVSKMPQKSGWWEIEDKNQGLSWGCHIVDGQIVTCEYMQTPETLQAVPSPTTTPASKRSTPDCTRLVNENHPDCRP